LFVVISCYPGGPENVQELDVAISARAPDKNFTGLQTYAMPDTIIHLRDPDETGNEISREFDDLILERVAGNLEALGWQRDANPDSLNPPDMYVFVSLTTTSWTAVSGGYPWGGYWGWYPGWGGCPGCGYWYPWYPPTVVNYETGTLFIDMFDPDDFNEEVERFEGSWFGALNGLLSGSSASTQRRLTEGINQIFAQSPYLRVQP
jgi:hypothetical protein